jgi:hypothetical protein
VEEQAMALHNVSQNHRSQVWVPTITIVTNIDALALRQAFFSITGALVSCYIAVDLEQTAATDWVFRCSLPMGREVTAVGDIVGMGGQFDGPAGFVGMVSGNIANNEASLRSQNGTEDEEIVIAHFSYLAG